MKAVAVEALVAKPAAEAFDKRVLHRLASLARTASLPGFRDRYRIRMTTDGVVELMESAQIRA